MPAESDAWSHRDSWPPTLVRLNPAVSKTSNESRPLLEDIDDSPLTYFLTPTPDNEGDDIGDEDMDFDAGIQDLSRHREMVRSVSPSSLEGLSRRPKTRAPSSPDLDSSDGLTTDEDEEEYIRFSPSCPSRLAPLGNIGIDGLKLRSRSPVPGRNASGLLSPVSYPAPQLRGRTYTRGRLGRARSLSVRPRPGRLWREPSPDVWSIEEETEEEIMTSEGTGVPKEEATVKQTVVKPKKRVRFLLPVGR